MMSELKPGDVVRLKSGSPGMTVEAVSGRSVSCAWFVDGALRNGSFDVDALMMNEQKVNK